MEGAIVGVFESALSKKDKVNANGNNKSSNNDILEELENVKMRLIAAESHFENQSDPDLIEASIYEIKSLTARYRYLMREAKRCGVTGSINDALEHCSHYN